MASSSVGGTESAEVQERTDGTGAGGGFRRPTSTGSGGGWFDWLKALIRVLLALIKAATQLVYRLVAALWKLFRPGIRSGVRASGFYRFHYHTAEAVPGDSAFAAGLRALATRAASFDDETVARLYLEQILTTGQPGKPVGLLSMPAASPLLLDGLRLIDVSEMPRVGTRFIRFEQTHDSVPVFGSLAICELGEGRGLISAKGSLAKIDSARRPKVRPAKALRNVERFTKTRLISRVGKPELTFFKAPTATDWHLTYHFTKVPAVPPNRDPSRTLSTVSVAPLPPRADYFVDAHNGSVIYHFISDPMVDVPSKLKVEPPTKLQGFDDKGAEREFFGRYQDAVYELFDPHLNISTRDLGFGDVVDCARGRVNFPDPLRSPTRDFGRTHSAAVSAHANASTIFRFFASVLNRQGVDGKGAELVNLVNCTYRRAGPPPTWSNAAWYYERMWYGQAPGVDGKLRTFARFIDVMAHELTHGVTACTSKLLPDAESGALNESFSDIFAIIVKNWDWTKPEDGGDVSEWDWDIGSGLSSDGGPLRDISNPSRTGAPAHTRDPKAQDPSSIHDNSCIPSKAAHNLLTAIDANGKRLFSPYDAALHYYWCLCNLSSEADFSEALQTLILVTQSFHQGDREETDRTVEAVRNSYSAVGITEAGPTSHEKA